MTFESGNFTGGTKFIEYSETCTGFIYATFFHYENDGGIQLSNLPLSDKSIYVSAKMIK